MRPRSTPGDGLVRVLPLAALALLIVNDRVLKTTWPGPMTGKLSDLAGLVVAPLAIQAAWEIGQWATGRWAGPSARVLAVAIVTVGLGFAAVQVWAPATDVYRWGLGVAQWPFVTLAALVAGAPRPDVAPVQAVADAGDLLALPTLGLTWWSGRRRMDREG